MQLTRLILAAVPLFGAERLEVPGATDRSPTVLLIGMGDAAARVKQEVRKFEATRQKSRPFRLLAIPAANPDGAALVFPPPGVAYRDHPESHTRWRWIALQGPDL